MTTMTTNMHANRIEDAGWDYEAISDLHDRIRRAETCGDLDDDAMTAMDEAQGRDLDREMCRALAEFKARILKAIETPGVRVDWTYDGMGSAYYDLQTVDGPVVTIRISNHKQRRTGPAWSFETGDAAADHQRGIEHVLAKVAGKK